MSSSHIRIGTRGSQLAQWQANWVAAELRKLGATVDLVEITTQGDTQQRGPIANIGVQGVFTKEIQSAMLEGKADIAVHSLKDLPTETVAGLVLAAVPERENPADALISRQADSLMALVAGAKVGTGSLRRQAQIRHLRSDLDVQSIRGNVDTRLRKLDEGKYDAVILAASGLNRLGLSERIVELLEPPRVLPAPGQGALGLECRDDDTACQELLAKLDHQVTHRAVDAERAMLAKLHGGCSAPVGSWGRVEAGQLVLDGLVASIDGKRVLKASARGELSEAIEVGHQVADQLLAAGGAEIVAEARGG